MEAAVDFAKNVKTYFVVGGSEKKVTDMKISRKAMGKVQGTTLSKNHPDAI